MFCDFVNLGGGGRPLARRPWPLLPKDKSWTEILNECVIIMNTEHVRWVSRLFHSIFMFMEKWRYGLYPYHFHVTRLDGVVTLDFILQLLPLLNVLLLLLQHAQILRRADRDSRLTPSIGADACMNFVQKGLHSASHAYEVNTMKHNYQAQPSL